MFGGACPAFAKAHHLRSSIDSRKLPGGPKASLGFLAGRILRPPGQFATRLVDLNLANGFANAREDAA
jgi:hypothetical protein